MLRVGPALAVLLTTVVGASCATVQTASGGTSRKERSIHVRPDRNEFRHRVASGETLYRISRAYGVSIDDLLRANDVDDPRELRAGELLRIPGARFAKAVPSGDSPEPVSPRAASAQRSTPAVAEKRAKLPPVTIGSAAGVLSWPLRGMLYARFGKKGNEPHDGIDLSAPAGTPVKTAAPGKVLFAGDQPGYGLIVIVEHENGLITLYAHNRDLRVKTNQRVREGQVVATVGDSGKTTGPHLHFEVRKDARPVDPLKFLGAVPQANGDNGKNPSTLANRRD